MYESVSTLDPHHHNEAVAAALLSNIYDGLVRTSPTMELEGALATSWEQVDPTHLRLVLRDGVRFHDGSPFGAADVVASCERARHDPRSRIRHQLADVRAVRADGDLAVVVETAAPAPTLINRLAAVAIVPHADAGRPEITDPVGTGPYRVVGPADGGGIELEAVQGWRGTAPVRRVVLSFIEDDQQRFERFLRGRYDVCFRLPDDQASDTAAWPGRRTVLQPRLAVQLLAVCPEAADGPTRAALADVRVRRAMLLALDRRTLVGKALHGNGTVASQFVHPVVFGYDTALQPAPYDPAAAQRLLAEAGFPGGFDVELGHGAGVAGIAGRLADDLAVVGIRVRRVQRPYGELVELARARRVPLVYYGWACNTGDAGDFLDTSVRTPDPEHGLGVENYSGYRNVEVDEVLAAAGREFDRERRRALLQQAQRRVLADLPVLPLTNRWWYVGVSDRLEVTTRHDGHPWVADYRWRTP
jgi:peptide/nickel transport system substrate-binding protein